MDDCDLYDGHVRRGVSSYEVNNLLAIYSSQIFALSQLAASHSRCVQFKADATDSHVTTRAVAHCLDHEAQLENSAEDCDDYRKRTK